jgi:hypothetical protein
LGDLDVFTLYDLFDRVAAESNPDLTVYSVQWEYWVNPQSLQFGADFTNKSIDFTCKVSNKLYEYDQIRAGCAAIVCAVFLIKHLPEHRSLNKNIQRKTSHRKIYDLSITLQDELGILSLNKRLDIRNFSSPL